MRLLRPVFRCAALLLALAGPTLAHAAPAHLVGSFSGVLSAEGLPLNFEPPRPISYYDGAPVTGTFELLIADPTFHLGTDSSAYYLNNAGFITVDFQVKEEHFRIHQGPTDDPLGWPSILLTQAGDTRQYLLAETDFRPRYSGGSIDIEGPAGSMFTGSHPISFAFDPTADLRFQFRFADATRSVSGITSPTQVTWQVLSPVPEPAMLMLGVAGLAGVAASARRRSPPSGGLPPAPRPPARIRPSSVRDVA